MIGKIETNNVNFWYGDFHALKGAGRCRVRHGGCETCGGGCRGHGERWTLGYGCAR